MSKLEKYKVGNGDYYNAFFYILRRLEDVSEKVKKENKGTKLLYEDYPQFDIVEKGIIFLTEEVKIQRLGKYIYYAESKEKAKDLVKEFEKIIDVANEFNKKKNPEKTKKKTLKLKIKVLPAQGEVVLSHKKAYKTQTKALKKVIKDSQEKLATIKMKNATYDTLGPTQRELFLTSQIEELTKLGEEIGFDTLVRATRPSGSSYRLTYYDLNEKKRKQLNLGDIIILYGSNDITLRENKTPKKTRKDSREFSDDILYQDEELYILEKSK